MVKMIARKTELTSIYIVMFSFLVELDCEFMLFFQAFSYSHGFGMTEGIVHQDTIDIYIHPVREVFISYYGYHALKLRLKRN